LSAIKTQRFESQKSYFLLIPPTITPWTLGLGEYEERLTFFQVSIGILLNFNKEFSLDLQEMIGADSFKNEIDALDKKIRYENVTKKT
jgi:hypothetical protein